MTEATIVNAIIESYIKVYGEAKWNSLSGDEQHAVIMTIVQDFSKMIG